MRVALMVSAFFDQQLKEQIEQDLTPQRDFFALADALDAEIIDTHNGNMIYSHPVVKLLNSFKTAWKVFRKRKDYDVVITDLERVGLTLAFLLKLTRSKKRHLMICHGRIVRPLDVRLVRTLRLDSHIHKFICYGSAAAEKVVRDIGASQDKVATVKHAADHRFWRPLGGKPERLIVSAGLSRRDYPTLIEAIRDMDVTLDIAAFSPWVPEATADGLRNTLPPNVRMEGRSPGELRDLYARSLFVAVPLQQRVTQVGSLVIYEAMAMGKAVVATRTIGQAGMTLIKENETGLFVAPGDIQGWKHAIQYLLDHPEEAERMGKNARSAVEAGMNMDGYVEEMKAIVQSLDDGAKDSATETRTAIEI